VEGSVELVRRAYGGFFARDVGPYRELFAQDFGFHLRPEFPTQDVYGVDDMERLWTDLGETFSEWELTPLEFEGVGEHVIVRLLNSTRLQDSEARFEEPVYHVWRVREGLIREAWTFSTREEAEQLAGNVEIMRHAYPALAEQGVDAMLAFVDPEHEVTTPPELASEPGTFRGHDGLRRYLGSFGGAMEGVYFEGREFTGVGDKVLVDTTMHARGRTTGIAASQRAFLVFTLRNGLVVRTEVFPELGPAREAAGLEQ
jgi:ketosteroid isomerase-like protein